MTWGAMAAIFLIVTLQLTLTTPRISHRWSIAIAFLVQFFALLLSFVRVAYVGFTAGTATIFLKHWKRLLLISLAMTVIRHYRK